MTRSHYDVLGVAPEAVPAEIRRAYLALARRHHPDRAGGDPATMRSLNEAWETLGDSARRAIYDLTIGPGVVAPPSDPPPAEAPRVDDLDDTPIGGAVALPGWLSVLPVGMFVASVALLVGGAAFGSRAATALSAAVFALSCALFLAAPFVALLASRRPPR